MAELRKYNTATTIYFPLINRGGQSFEATPVTTAAGDFQYSVDGGAFANCNSSISHEGNGIYSLALGASETAGAHIVITCIDQTATKEWEDQAILVSTYGSSLGAYALDLSDNVRAGLTALPNANADAAGGLVISDAGGLDADTMSSNVSAILTDTAELQGDLTDGGRLDLLIDQIAADNPNQVTKGVAFANLVFKLVDSTDLVTAETGKSVTATISKDGGAFAAMDNSVTEISNGWYKVALSGSSGNTETNADIIICRFTASGCADREVVIVTQPT